MLKIRRPLGRLIFNMEIAIPGKTVFLIETAPRATLYLWSKWYTCINQELRYCRKRPTKTSTHFMGYTITLSGVLWHVTWQSPNASDDVTVRQLREFSPGVFSRHRLKYLNNLRTWMGYKKSYRIWPLWHDVIVTWKYVPRCLPFVRWIHRLLVDFPWWFLCS